MPDMTFLSLTIDYIYVRFKWQIRIAYSRE